MSSIYRKKRKKWSLKKRSIAALAEHAPFPRFQLSSLFNFYHKKLQSSQNLQASIKHQSLHPSFNFAKPIFLPTEM
jgi:NAD-dependent SIR2 family protein deacetylase